MNNTLFSAGLPEKPQDVADLDVYREVRTGTHKRNTRYGSRKQSASSELAATTYDEYSGGGGGMDDIVRRIENLKRDQKELKEELNNKPSKSDLSNSMNELKLFLKDNFPNEDRIKIIVSEQIDSKKVATESFVEASVTKAKLSTTLWVVGTTIPIISIIFTIIRLFTK